MLSIFVRSAKGFVLKLTLELGALQRSCRAGEELIDLELSRGILTINRDQYTVWLCLLGVLSYLGEAYL